MSSLLFPEVVPCHCLICSGVTVSLTICILDTGYEVRTEFSGQRSRL